MNVPEADIGYVRGVLATLAAQGVAAARPALERVEKWQAPAELWTLTETAAFLRKKPEAVKLLARRHGLPAITLPGNGVAGDRLRFDPGAVRSWLQSRALPTRTR